MQTNIDNNSFYHLDMYSLLRKNISVKISGKIINDNFVTMQATKDQHGEKLLKDINRSVLKTLKSFDIVRCLERIKENDETANEEYTKFVEDCVIAQLLRLIIHHSPIEFLRT